MVSAKDSRGFGREFSTHTRNECELDASQDGIEVEVRNIECFLELLFVDLDGQVVPLALRPSLTGLHVDIMSCLVSRQPGDRVMGK